MEDWETWSSEKLDHEMSPSRWNPSKTADEVISEYVQTSIADTKSSRSSIPNELSVSYGNEKSQKYDIYGTDLPVDALICVWFHGGCWQEGSKDISGGFANVLYSQRVRTVVVGYTLAPAASLQEIEKETISALESIISRFPDCKVVCGGHSAGAQLAAMMLHSNDVTPKIADKIVGTLLVSGLYDLRLLVPTYINDPLKLTRESANASSPLQVRKINDKFLCKAANMKILMTFGEHDPPTFKAQAQSYFTLLKSSFDKTDIWRSPSDDHFSLMQNMARASSPAGTKFLEFMNLCADAIKK